jgi:MerR family transcriptional regulator, light-induced transcriptional regulator
MYVRGMENELPTAAQPRYPVRLAAQKSGVSPHVLRAWERRYHVVTPARSGGGQRLYSELDVQRLQLLRHLTGRGHGISQLAKLSLAELESLAATAEAAPQRDRTSDPAAEFTSAAVRAAKCLDAGDLQGVLERAAVGLGVPTFLDEVAGPSIREIGHGWRDGTISVAQEHLATVVFRQVLGWIIDTFEAKQPAPKMIVATPAGQTHELGALMAAAAASVENWDVVYLGADLPAAEVVSAARQAQARAVALSIVHPGDDPGVIHQIIEIRQALDPGVHIFLGGATVTANIEQFSLPGVRAFDSLIQFRVALRAMEAQRS